MGSNRIAAVIFDLDGTLIVSSVDFLGMRRRLLQLFSTFGVRAASLDEGMPTYEILERGLEALRRRGGTEESLRAVSAKAASIMDEVELVSAEEARVAEGAEETLRRLRDRGLRIGVLTRSCREYAERTLRRTGLRSLVDVVVARNDVENPKPHPDHALRILELLSVTPGQTVMLGDHPSDADCAQRAGIRFIAIARDAAAKKRFRGYTCTLVGDIGEASTLLK